MSNGLQRGILVALTSRTRRFETLADVLATGYARFPAKGIQINYLAVQLLFAPEWQVQVMLWFALPWLLRRAEA